MAVVDDVIIGVDPHKLSATIEVVNRRGLLVGAGRFTTDKSGYREMNRPGVSGDSGVPRLRRSASGWIP